MESRTPGSKDTLAQSFRDAARGILQASTGRNFRIECAIGVLAFFLCWLLHASGTEILFVIGFSAAVLAFECVNTAIEALGDRVTGEYDPLIKVAKDCAAGGVLIVSLGAFIAGCIIFIPKLIALAG